MKLQDKTKQKINEKSNLRRQKTTSKTDWSQRERESEHWIITIPTITKAKNGWKYGFDCYFIGKLYSSEIDLRLTIINSSD